jgi:hypothetical protein
MRRPTDDDSFTRKKAPRPQGGLELFLPMRLPVPRTPKTQLLCGLFVLEDVHEMREKGVPSSRYAPIRAALDNDNSARLSWRDEVS